MTYLGVKSIYYVYFYLTTDGITYTTYMAHNGSPPSGAVLTYHSYITPVGQEIVGF